MSPTEPIFNLERRALLDLTAEDFATEAGAAINSLGEPPYRVEQLRRWLYERTPESFLAMEGLPRRLREHLAASFVLHPLEFQLERVSSDGTRKFLWRRPAVGPATSTRGPGPLESVLIPDGRRVTYCLSTQAGCPVRCTFCATGYGGFAGNLSAAEIVDQVLWMRALSGVPPTNIVYMGMGEPLLNFESVARSLAILTDPLQVRIGARRITVSTVGIPRHIRELGRCFPQVKLALSLHAARDDLRGELIPLGRKHSLEAVLDAVRDHCRITGKKVTFEYVLLAGVNDGPKDAEDVARCVRGIPARINLIGFNPFGDAPYAKPDLRAMLRFRDILRARFPGDVTLRRSRGDDIQGACGQLSLAHTDTPRTLHRQES